MELKKSHKADLERHLYRRLLFSFVGIILFFLAVLELPYYMGTVFSDDSMDDSIIEELNLTRKKDEDEMISANKLPTTQEIREQINPVEKPERQELQDLKVSDKQDDIEEKEKQEEKIDPIDRNKNTLEEMKKVEQLPEFPGGMSEFVKWLSINLNYPTVARNRKIQGKVVISFIVNEDGTISNLQLAKKAHPLLDNEAMRVAKTMPNWKPGQQNGKPCKTFFAVPIDFKL